jgi:hypothetical protein
MWYATKLAGEIRLMINGIAIALFIALFTFGRDYFAWGGRETEIQLALFASFLFGILASWRSR